MFCRRCGIAWPHGGNTCGACGEPIEAPTIESDDGGSSRRLLSAIGLYFVMLATVLGPTVLFDTFSLGLLIGVGVVNVLVVALWVGVKWERLRPIFANPGRPEDWGWALLFVPLTVTLALGTEALFVNYFDFVRPRTFVAIHDHFASLPALLFLMAAQPALVEEVAFRGVIFDGLDDLLGRREVIIATALMFMILHLAMLSIVFLVVMGLALGWLRHRSQSIWPPIALHFLHNSIVILWSMAQPTVG